MSADTLVPGVGGQHLSRYMYTVGNPIRYVDPSGNDPLDTAWEDEFYKTHNRKPTDLDRQYFLYSIAYPGPVSGGWPWTDKDWAYLTLNHNKIYGSTENRKSLDDFSNAIERISWHYKEGEEAQFVCALALLYSGWPYDPTGSNIMGMLTGFKHIDMSMWETELKVPSGTLLYSLNHGMEGFSKSYYHNAENTHHFVGHLMLGYYYGLDFNMIATFGREIMQRGHDMIADIQMGIQGGIAGWSLREGYVTIDKFAADVSILLRVKQK